MTALILRPYQRKAIDEIKRHYAAGIKKVLLHLATGGGKTVIFCAILGGAVAKRRTAIMVVRGKQLVDNASKRLIREGIDHGCLQGNHWNKKPLHPIQVCSIDTLYRRKLVPPADIVVIDEAHYAASESFRWLIAQYPNAYFLPVTATPHVKEGLRHVADEVVYPITIKELIEQGYLSSPTYYAPTHLELGDVSIDSSTSDYNNKEVAGVLGKSTVYGDIIAHYKRLCDGQPAVLFAINIEHSNMMVARFKQAGIEAVHVEADTSMTDREEALERLRTGEIKVICNVGILTTGIDIPFLRAVILARPTKSYNLYIQMVGRGTRVAENKTTFLVLDHANNLEEHGFIEAEEECDLDGGARRMKSERLNVTCEACYMVFVPIIGDVLKVCPMCGHKNGKAKSAPASSEPTKEDMEAKLQAIKYAERAASELSIQKDLTKLIKKATTRNYEPGWVYHKLKDLHGKEAADKRWLFIKKSVHKRPQQLGGQNLGGY